MYDFAIDLIKFLGSHVVEKPQINWSVVTCSHRRLGREAILFGDEFEKTTDASSVLVHDKKPGVVEMGPICGPFRAIRQSVFRPSKSLSHDGSMGLTGIFAYMKNHKKSTLHVRLNRSPHGFLWVLKLFQGMVRPMWIPRLLRRRLVGEGVLEKLVVFRSEV